MSDATPWIMMMAMHAARGLPERCKTAAAALRASRYEIMRLRFDGQSRMDLWLMPLSPWKDDLPEIRVADDPVPVTQSDPAIVMELVAQALCGPLMSEDEGMRVVQAMMAVVASEGLMERCAPGPRGILKAGMATSWGPAATSDVFASRSGRIGPDGAPMPPRCRPIGDAALLLPTCSMIDLRNEPGHPAHIRVEPFSAICTRANAPDAMQIVRCLADLAERPLR